MIAGYLTRQPDGRYVFSARRPILTQVDGTRLRAFYPEPGDPFWMPGMCPHSFHAQGISLKRYETAEITWDVQFIEKPYSATGEAPEAVSVESQEGHPYVRGCNVIDR